MAKLLNYLGRPCEITGGRTGLVRLMIGRKAAWKNVTYQKVRYLDGLQPVTQEITAGRLKKAKAIRESETLFWRRLDDLVTGGMELQRATEQARAEVVKGILAPALF